MGFHEVGGSSPSRSLLRATARLPRRRDDEPSPPPPVSTPDLALQISFCLPSEINEAVVRAVKEAFTPAPDVRSACIDGTQRIGVWLRSSFDDLNDQARNRGLEQLRFSMGAGETMVFFVNSVLIARQAAYSWADRPKRLNGNGDPDPDGSIHLTNLSVRFESPDRVLTHVDGFYDRGPDVDFQFTITDTLSVSGGQVQCDSDSDLNVDSSWLSFLSGLSVAIPAFSLLVLAGKRIIVASADIPASGGAGCAAAELIPQEITIPGGQKVVMSYSRLQVNPGGIFAGGFFEVIPRSPSVTVTGPSEISVVEGTTSVTRSYSLRTDDLRPALQFAWSGDGFVARPREATARFVFQLGETHIGQVLDRQVTVQVTDADNLVGSGARTARIHVTSADNDIPPICRVKPWLPQCKDALGRVARRRGAEPGG